MLEKPGTVITFVDQVMNNLIYKEHFDILSEQVFRSIHGTDIFESFEAEDLIDLDVFSFADKVIIEWIINRLSDENLNATIDGKKIQDICQYRIKKHYGYRYSSDYMMLQHGYNILKAINITFEKSPVNVVKKYDEEYYKFDMSYRKFYYYFDQIKENSRYEKLASLIENVYINKYLDPLDIGFNNEFNYEAFSGYYKLQKDFYRNYLGNSKEREVIIISDAFRYEVAKELVERLLTNEKMKASIEPNIGILPSITKVGMAALLPHDEIGIDEEYNVQVDGDPCNSLVQRQAILKKKDKKAVCIQFDEIKKYKRDKLREFVQDTSKIYIYHIQIDTRGDDLKTEDEVFVACEEAINEIIQLINRLTIDVSAHKYIITSDHGFIYKREPISEAEKINKFYETGDYANRRFVISNKVYEEQGTYNIKLNREMGISCNKCMTFPNTSNVLKLPGGGQNFFHGGLSPQEIIIPVVRIKTVRGAVVTNPAKITLISIIPKITNLNVSLEFVQSEPVSELIKPATYKIYFADKNGNTISNIEELIANKRDKETAKRISKLSFRFKDMKYDRSDEYYLIAMNVNSGANLIKQKVVMDIVFSSGFGFDI